MLQHFLKGSMAEQWLELLPHTEKVAGSYSSFLQQTKRMHKLKYIIWERENGVSVGVLVVLTHFAAKLLLKSWQLAHLNTSALVLFISASWNNLHTETGTEEVMGKASSEAGASFSQNNLWGHVHLQTNTVIGNESVINSQWWPHQETKAPFKYHQISRVLTRTYHEHNAAPLPPN